MDNNLDNLHQEFIEKQKVICSKYGAKYLASPFYQLAGIALESFNQFNMLINGLRHLIESEHSTSWFIWAGNYSDADDLFKPVHVSPLIEICPNA